MSGDWLPQTAGWAGYAALAGAFLKYGSEWFQNRRREKLEDEAAPVRDAATANAALVLTLQETQAALRDERADNRAKDSRIDELELRNDELRGQLREATDAAAREIRLMQVQLNALTDQLDGLRRKFGIEDEDAS